MARSLQATLKDVARLAKVSTSTASRALSNNPAISEATREKVKECAKQLNYQPNEQARALRQSRTNIIGLIVPSLINPYFAEMGTTIQGRAAQLGMTTLIANTNEKLDELRASMEMMISQRVDGLIVVPSEGIDDLIERARDTGVPIVMLDRAIATEGVTSITSDASVGITQAVEHLKEQRHLPIGYLAGPDTTSTGRERKEAFKQACKDAGLTVEHIYHCKDYLVEEGRAGTKELLSKGVKALIAGDSMMTIGVLEQCRDENLEIGKDVAVVGFDNYPLFELQPKPITIIDQNVADMSVQAMDILYSLIEAIRKKEQLPKPQSLKTGTNLVVRQSTQF